MVKNVNGAAAPNEAMTGNMDFWTFQTTMDITPTGVIVDEIVVNPAVAYPFDAYGITFNNAGEYTAAKAAQAGFDALVKAISTRTQPIIMGDVVKVTDVTPIFGLPVTNIPAPGTPVDVFTVKFAIEHAAAWDNVDFSLTDTLDGVESFVFTVPTTNNNIYAVKSNVL